MHTSLWPELDRQFALSATPRLIVAGSTAPGEEELLIAAFREARKQSGLEDTRLIIAPRHPERFNEVAALLAQSGFKFARRSPSRPLPTGANDPRTADIILLDTIGELAAIYSFAALVFVGGSLVPRGGHNIIEPAAYAKPIIVGPYTENFRQIIADFTRANALVQISAETGAISGILSREIIRLLSDDDLAKGMGARARDILLKNQGATECAVAAILEIIEKESSATVK